MKTVSAICLDSPSNPNPVLDCLAQSYRVDYRHLDHCDFDPDNRHCHETVVVLLDEPRLASTQIKQQIRHYLARAGHQRLFCVISRAQTKAFADSDTTEFLALFHDIIFWPCEAGEILARIERFSIRENQVEEINQQLLREFSRLNLIGESHTFQQALALIQKVSRCDAPVLIEGETGTGKENAARAIHYLSERADKGFIPINCGALPDELLESELFGHSRGAFTDAKENKAGLVSIANGGTLFLDEINSLSAKAQAVLLRFLQSGEYRPLGGKSTLRADVRVLAASNANLGDKVEAGMFRGDLLFRLQVLRVKLPPLRERPGDIEILTRSFLQGFARTYKQSPKILSALSLHWLNQQTWPGNVRELENTLLRHFLLTDGEVVHIGEDSRPNKEHDANKPVCDSFQAAKAAAIRQFEKTYLTRILRRTSGNVSEAARISGKERRALGKLLQKYQIDKEWFYV